MFEVQVRHDDLPYRHVDVLGRAEWRESVGIQRKRGSVHKPGIPSSV